MICLPVAGQIQQVAKAQGTQPLIIPQGQATSIPKVMVQQILKQQQIITSVAPPASTSTGAVLATQLVPSGQAMQTVTKMTVPSGVATTSVMGQARASVPMTMTAMTVQPNTSIMTGTAGVTHTIVSGAGATTMAVPSQTTLVSPQKGVLVVLYITDNTFSPLNITMTDVTPTIIIGVLVAFYATDNAQPANTSKKILKASQFYFYQTNKSTGSRQVKCC